MRKPLNRDSGYVKPYLFKPKPDIDNGPVLREAIEKGERWIQINDDYLRLDTTVSMNKKDGTPAHGLIIEPAPGIRSVLVEPSYIGRSGTDPSKAAFDYEGKVVPGSRLSKPAGNNQNEIFVEDTTKFKNGEWIVLSAESTNPDFPLPKDGPMELRQVLRVLSRSLVLNRVLIRAYKEGVVVAKCTPIRDVFIRGLQFTGNCGVGIHMHHAMHCTVQGIRSVKWNGGTLVLLDNCGFSNLVEDCYCTGSKPPVHPEKETDTNIWGISMEGQDSSRMVNVGAENCGDGIMLNYGIDTLCLGAIAHHNNCNIRIHWESIRCRVIRPRIGLPHNIDWANDKRNTDCFVIDPQTYSPV